MSRLYETDILVYVHLVVLLWSERVKRRNTRPFPRPTSVYGHKARTWFETGYGSGRHVGKRTPAFLLLLRTLRMNEVYVQALDAS